MTFLDEMDKKLTQLGNSVAQKTKGLTETAKITVEINAEELKIRQGYAEIGKLFTQQMQMEDIPEEYRELYQQILASENKIAKLEAEQNVTPNVENLINCPVCNLQISADSVFCNGCGAKIGDAINQNFHKEAQTVMEKSKYVCTYCGEILNEGQLFCINCGRKVDLQPQNESRIQLQSENKIEENSELTDMTELVPIETTSTSFKEKRQNICSSCGAELKEDQIFCIKCGAKRK